MTAASAATIVLPAAHIALQQPVHRTGAPGHVFGDFLQHAFLHHAFVGLNGSSFLASCLANPVSQREFDAEACFSGALAFDFETALQPGRLLEDQTELRRRPEVVQDADRRSRGRASARR